MTLEEAFKIYSDDQLMRRKKDTEFLKDCGRTKEENKKLMKSLFIYPIHWLKKLYSGVMTYDPRALSFVIPDRMLEDARATDWELYK